MTNFQVCHASQSVRQSVSPSRPTHDDDADDDGYGHRIVSSLEYLPCDSK